MIDTCQHCSTSRANQALRLLANAGFQNRGVCLQAFPSFLPFPLPPLSFFWLLFHFSRGQNLEYRSSVFLCSETKRKRLLRRLSGERCLTQLCHFLTTCIFYKAFTAGRFADAPKQISVCTGKSCHFDSSRGVIFTCTYLLRSLYYMKKNYSAIARRKNIPFHPARNGINFPYFQLARRSFKFPSQLISQCNFSQLAQILYEERVFCRAAPLGTPGQSSTCD